MKLENLLGHLPTDDILSSLGLETRSRSTTRVFAYAGLFAAGVVVGAGAAWLLAPRSGDRLRNSLAAGVKDISDQVASTASRVAEAAKQRANAARNGAIRDTASDGPGGI